MSTNSSEFFLRSRRVVTPSGLRAAAIHIKDGVIVEVIYNEQALTQYPLEDFGELVVMPGLVDIHVHLNEPGRTEWEGFETGAQAAAAGGVTTLVDMPLNSTPVTTTTAALQEKRKAASKKLWVDCGLHAGLVPGNHHELEALIKAGVLGVKTFLVHSGIDDFPNATEADLRAAMPIIAKHGLPLLVHAEIETVPATAWPLHQTSLQSHNTKKSENLGQAEVGTFEAVQPAPATAWPLHQTSLQSHNTKESENLGQAEVGTFETVQPAPATAWPLHQTSLQSHNTKESENLGQAEVGTFEAVKPAPATAWPLHQISRQSHGTKEFESLSQAVVGTYIANPRSYQTYLASRPPAWELEAIALMIKLCEEYHCRVHIVHLSSAAAIPMLRQARARGLPLTVETCPHYLFFTAEEIPDGDTRFKCAPPIRERDNRELLWAALQGGAIDFIASDHSPCPPKMKRLDEGDFMAAWGGIASLQFTLPVIWTAARQRGFSLFDLSEWLCRRPAEVVGLRGRKGAIAPGYDADFVVWNPEASFTLNASMIHHRHKVTPYEGREFYGVVEKTFLRGEKVYEQGNFKAEPAGKILVRFDNQA